MQVIVLSRRNGAVVVRPLQTGRRGSRRGRCIC